MQSARYVMNQRCSLKSHLQDRSEETCRAFRQGGESGSLIRNFSGLSNGSSRSRESGPASFELSAPPLHVAANGSYFWWVSNILDEAFVCSCGEASASRGSSYTDAVVLRG